jgi:LuxR family transcriptional regulator, maltose regulon positive regulatory protein
MFTDLLASKITIPPLRPSLVARPRLIRSLNEGLSARRRLTLVSAPAGFGKTTLVVDWLRQSGCPAAWLSLEEADNDLPRFLAYLGAALRQVDEELGAPLRSTLENPQLPAVEKMLAGLLNEIAARPEPLLLVLDDYHVLAEAAILEGLGFLVEHQPQQLHLVFTTREDPDLPLARLRARDQLTEIRARDLRFSHQESSLYLRDVMGLALSEGEVTALEDRTEGWAAGLQLAGLSMQQTDPGSFIAEFSGSHRHILDYLTEEVLERQPEDIRSFLLQTSILDRLSASLCDDVTGRSDSSQILTGLEAANLFIIPLDSERRWYRYHHLFSDLLRSHLYRLQPDSIPRLHRRAGRWYEAHGEIQAAIEHALQDTDLTRAAQLVEQHMFPNLYHGRISTVLGWFDGLPEQLLESAPMLCIGKAWALSLLEWSVDLEQVDRTLHMAVGALDRIQADEDLRSQVRGHLASIQAFLLPNPPPPGETPQKVITLSIQAQELLPAGEKAIRSVNALNIGHAYLSMSDLPAARRAFEQTLAEGLEGGNYYAAVYGAIQLIMIELLVGRYEQALRQCEFNIQRFNRIHAGQVFPALGVLYVLKGSLLLEWDRLAEAEPLLIEGLDLVRWTEESTAHRIGYCALARLRAIQGERGAMEQAIQTLEEMYPRWAPNTRAMRHHLSLRHWPDDPGVRAEAASWLAQAGIDFEHLPLIETLNPISNAYFEIHLHAAHILAHLAKELPDPAQREAAQGYLHLQLEFAGTHRLVNWQVPGAITQALLHQAAGRREKAIGSLEAALRTAAPAGLLRVFVDECDSLLPLLRELLPRLQEGVLVQYAGRILAASGGEPVIPKATQGGDTLLSERELDVLKSLAVGLSYEEIGRQLFLSLNTVQFHVKNIYGKLLVHKRLQAIERAREMGLI